MTVGLHTLITSRNGDRKIMSSFKKNKYAYHLNMVEETVHLVLMNIS